MNFVLKELQDGLKYHQKQLDENQNKIQFNYETIEDLKQRSETHQKAIEEIGDYIEQIKKADKTAILSAPDKNILSEL